MKKFLFLAVSLLALNFANAEETLVTKTGKVTFNSKASLEDITATNNACSSIIKTSTGEVAYQMNIKGFEFANHSMQEHFNEKYMESEKYPKAVFKGTITNLKDVNFKKDGTYNAKVTGTMTIHGVTKPMESTAAVTVKGGKVSVSSKFQVVTADFKIEIPSMVKDKIAKVIDVTTSGDYDLKS